MIGGTLITLSGGALPCLQKRENHQGTTPFTQRTRKSARAC